MKGIPSHLVPIHADNAGARTGWSYSQAGTIIGPSPERLVVARATLEPKIVRKYNLLLRAQHFLRCGRLRSHEFMSSTFALQLYKYWIFEKKLVPLQGEEIGRLIAHALEGGIKERRPWYEPTEKLPDQPIIGTPLDTDFNSLVVDIHSARNTAGKGSYATLFVAIKSPPSRTGCRVRKASTISIGNSALRHASARRRR